MDTHNSGKWVDERIGSLSPAADWRPDTERALALLNEQRSRKRHGTVWVWGAAAAAVACVCLLAFPTLRDVVGRLWPERSTTNMVYMGQAFADVKTIKDKQAAPDFMLKDAAGKQVRLSDYRGKVVLLNFWATWCGGCQTEIPWLVEFDQKYRDKGLAVIGISMDDGGWTILKPYLEEKNVVYTVVIGNDETANAYGMIGMPMTFLVSRDGKISAESAGIVDKEECEKEILRLLGN
jgi:peroxiredoxin